MSRPHVVFVSPVGEMGGAEQVFLTLARRVADHGFSSSLALLRPGPLDAIAREQKIPVDAFPENYRWRDLGSVNRTIGWLADVFRKRGASIAHVNHAGHVPTWFACRRARVPEVWHLYDFPYKFDPVDFVNRRFAPDFTLFSTPKVASGYPRLAGDRSAVVLPNCLEIRALQDAPPDPSIRERHGLGDDPFFLTVARLQPHKGLHFLIDAAKIVVESHPATRFVLAGKASGPEQEAYRDQLLAQIQTLGLRENVRLAGFVSDSDLSALRREAVALAHPATSEGYGLVLIEAMALGTPVVVAASDGPSVIVDDGVNGLLVPVADPPGLASGLIRVLDDPALRANLGAGARATAETMDVARMVEETVAIYRRCLKPSDRKPSETSRS